MKDYLYGYKIYDHADPDIFYRQCNALEKNIPGLKKKQPLLEDVDGTLIQDYEFEGAEVRVLSDAMIDYVTVLSETELERFFHKEG